MALIQSKNVPKIKIYQKLMKHTVSNKTLALSLCVYIAYVYVLTSVLLKLTLQHKRIATSHCIRYKSFGALSAFLLYRNKNVLDARRDETSRCELHCNSIFGITFS